jgi:hypothetical protein
MERWILWEPIVVLSKPAPMKIHHHWNFLQLCIHICEYGGLLNIVIIFLLGCQNTYDFGYILCLPKVNNLMHNFPNLHTPGCALGICFILYIKFTMSVYLSGQFPGTARTFVFLFFVFFGFCFLCQLNCPDLCFFVFFFLMGFVFCVS